MKKGRLVLTIALGLICSSFIRAFGQPAGEDFNEILQIPLYFSEATPESPIGIFSLNFPFYFPTSKPVKNQLSLAFTMGNTWHPQAHFYYPQNLSPEQKAEVRGMFMTQRPGYFEKMGIETKVKMFQSDGVLEHYKFSYLTNWRGKHSLILNFNLHQLAGGESWINYPASDRFIEYIHSNFATEDNFSRKLFPFNKAFIQFNDESGDSFRKDKGDIFTSVLDGHYYRQLHHYRGNNFYFSSQVGAHLSVPLNQLHPYIIPGISAGFRTDFRLLPRCSFTLAATGGVTDQTFLKVGKEVKAIDWKYRKNAQTFGCFNFMLKKKKSLMLGVLLNYQDPLMKGYYFTRDETGYEEIGIQFLTAGETWEGEPVTNRFNHSKLTPAALYFFSIRTCFMVGFRKNGNELIIYAGQDNFVVNNAPDIQYSFQYRFSPFDKKYGKLLSWLQKPK